MSSHFSILKNFPVFPNFRPSISGCSLNEGREGSTLTPLHGHLVLTAPFSEDFPFPSTHSQQPWGRAAGCGRVGFQAGSEWSVCCMLMHTCHCNYCGFVLYETKQCNASCFVLFVQDCFGNWSFFRDAFFKIHVYFERGCTDWTILNSMNI